MKQRQTIMNELREQYRHASKNEKSRILDEFVDLTHLNCSYARSTLRAKTTWGRGPVHRPRASVYTATIAHWPYLDKVLDLIRKQEGRGKP